MAARQERADQGLRQEAHRDDQEGARERDPPRDGVWADAGFLPRDDVVERYAEQSGRDVSQLDFYEALAAYKLAIILEGIHARFLMGKTVGEGFDHIGSLVEEAQARLAEEVALPPGYCWNELGQMEMDPDERVCEAIRMVLRKFRELGSARQVLLWAVQADLQLPVMRQSQLGARIEWQR
jgi:hypothetical protein